MEKRGPAFSIDFFFLRQIWTMYNFNFPKGVIPTGLIKFSLSLDMRALECNLSLIVTVLTVIPVIPILVLPGVRATRQQHGWQRRRKSRGDSKQGNPPPTAALALTAETHFRQRNQSPAMIVSQRKRCGEVLTDVVKGIWMKWGFHEAAHVTIPPPLALVR